MKMSEELRIPQWVSFSIANFNSLVSSQQLLDDNLPTIG